MALVVLLRVFKVVFKTLQKFEISHLITKMTNINIWITLTFTYDLFYFLKLSTNGPHNASHDFQSNFEDSM